MKKAAFVPPDMPLPRKVATGLARIGVALKARAWQEAGGRGLTPTQGQILALLAARAGRPMCLREVADGLGTSAPTASDTLKTLERKRLVARARAEGDARSLAVVLTPRGRAEAARVSTWSDFLLEGVEDLRSEEQEALLRLLLRLIRGLQEKEQIPVSAMCLTCRFFQPNAHPGARRPHHCAFVDAPFADGTLRLDCGDHDPAPAAQAAAAFSLWSSRA